MVNNRPSLMLIARHLVVVAVSTMGLNCGSPSSEKQNVGVQQKSIEVVQTEHTDALMSIPGVVGTAIGNCDEKPCIKVLVNKKNPELLKKIPTTLEGYAVQIDESGEFRRLDSR